MKAIILAAGQGKRLENLTHGLPKCLLKLGPESIIERETRILTECGFRLEDIFVVGGYKYEMIENIAPNLIVNELYNVKDNSYSLGLALQTVNNDDLLILDADLCFEKELIKELLSDKHKNVLMSKRSDDLEESTGIVTNNKMEVSAIGKKYYNTGFVYISIFKIANEVIFDFRKSLLNDKNVKTWYTLALTEVCKKYVFYNHVTMQKWHEIDFPEDYYETIKLFNLEEKK